MGSLQCEVIGLVLQAAQFIADLYTLPYTAAVTERSRFAGACSSSGDLSCSTAESGGSHDQCKRITTYVDDHHKVHCIIR